MLLEVKLNTEQNVPQRPVLSRLGNDLYWQYMEIKNPIIEEMTLTKYFLFTEGKRIEGELFNILRNNGINIFAYQSEVFTGIEYNNAQVKGKIDGMIRVNGERLLLEIKTMGSKQFYDTPKIGLMETNYTYFVQCQMYMHYLKAHTPDLEACMMLLYNKNNSALYEDIIAYDEEFALYHVDRLKKLVWHLNNEVIPEFEYAYDDPKNKYNPYLKDYPQPDKKLLVIDQ